MMYIDIVAPRDVRRKILRLDYGFTCECTYCDLPDEAVAHSDLSRAKLREWYHTKPKYVKWSTDLCRADDLIIISHQEALALIEQEEMYGLQCLYIEEIMMSYALLGEEIQFRRWAQMLLTLCVYQNPKLTADLRRWLENPRSMKKWAWRKKQRLRECLMRNTLSFAPTELILRGLEMENRGRKREVSTSSSPELLSLALLF